MGMRILFFGDVFGRIGRSGLIKVLPKLKKRFQPDLIIANVDNLAHGKGATIKTLRQMLDAGVDCFTSGDHFWSKKEGLKKIVEAKIPIVRPANFFSRLAGARYLIFKHKNKKILLLNLMGRTFSKHQDEKGKSRLANPFIAADKILKQFPSIKIKLVDFHAEATSEKVSLGYYLDGRVSAVLGTHTHIPTADEKILDQGTAYITDLGMVGPKDSVIGVKKEIILDRFLHNVFTGSINMQIPENGPVVINGVYLDIDDKTGRAKKIKRINLETRV